MLLPKCRALHQLVWLGGGRKDSPVKTKCGISINCLEAVQHNLRPYIVSHVGVHSVTYYCLYTHIQPVPVAIAIIDSTENSRYSLYRQQQLQSLQTIAVTVSTDNSSYRLYRQHQLYSLQTIAVIDSTDNSSYSLYRQ